VKLRSISTHCCRFLQSHLFTPMRWTQNVRNSAMIYFLVLTLYFNSQYSQDQLSLDKWCFFNFLLPYVADYDKLVFRKRKQLDKTIKQYTPSCRIK